MECPGVGLATTPRRVQVQRLGLHGDARIPSNISAEYCITICLPPVLFIYFFPPSWNIFLLRILYELCSSKDGFFIFSFGYIWPEVDFKESLDPSQ